MRVRHAAAEGSHAHRGWRFIDHRGRTPFDEEIVMWWKTQAAAPVVRNVDARHRYETLVGEVSAGFTAYRDRDGQRVFFHTEIDDAYAGRGLASVLVREALGHVRDSGKRIVPVCPYVAKFLKRHEQFADITDSVTPEIVQWLETIVAR